MKIRAFMKLLPSIFHFLLSLAGIWISSGIKFRRARKAFKMELLRSGLPSEAMDSLVRSYGDMRKEFFMNLIRGARLVASRRSIFANNVKEEEIPRGSVKDRTFSLLSSNTLRFVNIR